MRVRFFLSACFLSIAAAASAAEGDKLPLLKDTMLYTQTATGCAGAELVKGNRWVKILVKYKIEYFDIDICNDGQYPIIHPDFRYDPEDNSKYNYTEFYKDLIKENGYSPLSVVDGKRGKILNLSWTKPHDLHIETELFDAQ